MSCLITSGAESSRPGVILILEMKVLREVFVGSHSFYSQRRREIGVGARVLMFLEIRQL
ncbi:MAG: hypothetical protein KDB11_33605 [Planctomycetales bacterium]|nr:hypothetical protein [Planctomycetales bacterium]